MKRQPFHFVVANPASERERKREVQLARSHTARINREKRQTKSQPTSARGSRAGRPPVVKSAASKQISVSGKAVEPEDDYDEISRALKELDLPSSQRTSSVASQTFESARDHFEGLELVPSQPRTLSPVLGAQTTTTFSRAASLTETARAADYCLNVIWPNLLIDKAASTKWFELFKERPLIFHAFHYALAIHHDILCSRIDWSTSRQVIAHKSQTLRLLHSTLSNLSDENIELAILAILVLASNELQPEKLLSDNVLLFDPHLPGANWNSVYTRMDQIPTHGQAMVLLIQKRGGLKQIKLPGLASVLALCVHQCGFEDRADQIISADVMASSAALSRPIFPCFWNDDVAEISWLSSLYLDDGNAAGHGFKSRVPDKLPHEALGVLMNISRVDTVMEICRDRRMSDEDLKKVVNVRNRAQHQLLSLPSWDELSEVAREGSKRAAYECCRLTALLYSTAVIFPQPPHSGWHARMVRDVKALLTAEVVGTWREVAPSLLLWVLVIGGIAAFRTNERQFFESTLKSTLISQDYLLPKPAVRTAVREFIWSDAAAGRGFVELWNALELGSVGELDVE